MVEVERTSVSIRPITESNYDKSVRLREDAIKRLVDSRLRDFPHGTLINIGATLIDKPIGPDHWTRVRIPLSHLDASGRQLRRVSIKNFSSQPASFWVDEIRLVGAWRVYLPVILRSQ